MYTSIDDEDAVEMLMERLEEWTDDEEIQDLYRAYYENAVAEGYFSNFDVKQIVDNDWVNWTGVVCKEDCSEETWEALLEHWDNGDRDISELDCDGCDLEVMNSDRTMALVHY